MAANDVSHFMAESTPEGDAGTSAEERTVDVLILTALEDELEAVLALREGWTERKDRGGFPYRQRELGANPALHRSLHRSRSSFIPEAPAGSSPA
jgi:hypothetical protein